MQATLLGGPYDGMIIDHNDINLRTRLIPIGIRSFFAMPPRNDWDAVCRGDKDKNGPFDGLGSMYELVRTATGLEGRFDADGTIFAMAMQEYQEGRQSVPIDLTKWEYYQCFHGDSKQPFPAGYFPVTDEKGRQWMCLEISKEVNDKGGTGPMLTNRMSCHAVETREELVAVLADWLD